MKRITALITAILTVAACVFLGACAKDSGDGTPRGMKLASADSAPYKFYVPEMWQSDVASGASIAHYSSSDTSSVSVMVFSLEHSADGAAEWWASFEEDFKLVYRNFTVVSKEDAELDGNPAMKVVYTGELEHKDPRTGNTTFDTFKFMQIVSVKTKALSLPEAYVITYTSNPEMFDKHTSDLDKIIENFKFN